MKKKFCYLLTLIMIVCSFTIYAEENESMSVSSSSNTDDKQFTVDASIASNGTVTVPKTISITSATVHNYKITATGSIGGDEKLVIDIDDSLTLSQPGKTNNVCAITQTGTHFRDSAYNGTDTTAPKLGSADTVDFSIDATSLTAGSWTGVFNIEISITKD